VVTDAAGTASVPTQETCSFPMVLSVPFVRCDANGDQDPDLSDAVEMISILFLESGGRPCEEGDCNDDADFNVADPVYLLNYLFNGGSEPQPPFPDLGGDPAPAFPVGCRPADDDDKGHGDNGDDDDDDGGS
jgi:hypothetical protein